MTAGEVTGPAAGAHAALLPAVRTPGDVPTVSATAIVEVWSPAVATAPVPAPAVDPG